MAPFAAHSAGDDKLERTATEALGYIAGFLVGVGRLMISRKVLAFLLINAGVFIGAAALLPRATQYFYTGPISQFINSRYHWDVAWMVTLASACITTGLMVFFDRKAKP